jgi:hypothetical protein
MPKRSPRIKLFEWRIIRLRATPAQLIGYFEGASADDAIKRAIVEREISDPLTPSVSRAGGARDRHMIKRDPDINDGKEWSEMRDGRSGA